MHACTYLLNDGAVKIRITPTISSTGYISLKRRSARSVKLMTSSEEPPYLTPTQFTVKGLNHKVEDTGSDADVSTSCDEFPQETTRL